ncbi:protein GVQW3-like [Stegodyphus dumicola]|uniref:protein GVQW3-like n=1 Tax=Stegodyphus dumicola TaxID=202533 RepID=UPI0015AE8044|nr:protein GVQW3-like [Stegodyphus dumicola]
MYDHQVLPGVIQEASKKEARSCAMVFMWHRRFKDGGENVEDDDHSGKPSSSRTDQNVERVRELLNNDRRPSTRLIADELDSVRVRNTVWKIMTENLNYAKSVCQTGAKSFVGGSEETAHDCLPGNAPTVEC